MSKRSKPTDDVCRQGRRFDEGSGREGQDRDRSAENEIVRRSLPRLRRFAHGRLPPAVRNGYDTEDIVQDSILQTLQRLPAFDPARPGGLQAYLRWRCRTRSRMRSAGGRDSDRSGTWPNRWTVVRHRTMRSRRRRWWLGRRPCSTGCVSRSGAARGADRARLRLRAHRASLRQAFAGRRACRRSSRASSRRRRGEVSSGSRVQRIRTLNPNPEP